MVLSPSWNGRRGAATWGDGMIGVSGTPDAGNSLTGSNVNDQVGIGGVTALGNGNYVVLSPDWNSHRGAATRGEGTIRIAGTVDAGNSLLGSNPGNFCSAGSAADCVGSGGVTALSNGNYVVLSPLWNGQRGAISWGDGTSGVSGIVDAGNSLVGSNAHDLVGASVTALSNGNYVVYSSAWNGHSGAVTWGDGMVGVTGTVNAGNSLVGSNANDQVGDSVTALSNGNYVVRSPDWNGYRGAVTWGDGKVGITGTVDAGNSLVGSNANDLVGVAVTALMNGNYVVLSYAWNDQRGAATWGDGTIGLTGTVDASNSLVGSSANDQVGYHATALRNGNYVVYSFNWNAGRGAATWGDGTTGLTGTVNAANSLAGSNPGNWLSLGGVVALTNGNYVVASPFWSGNHGAATWGDGMAGITGTVNAGNSLIGSNPDDEVGSGVAVLSNGNYVVRSPFWNGNRGAVTWADGTVGVTGTIDIGNSLIGSHAGNYCGSGSADCVGSGGVASLSNGNYVVRSPFWNGNRGAVTWGDGAGGITGVVDDTNSLVG